MDTIELEFEYRREDENFRSIRLLKRIKTTGNFFRSKYGIFASLPLLLLCFMMVAGYVTVFSVALTFMAFLIWYRNRNIWLGLRIAADDASPIFGRKCCRVDDKGISIESDNMKNWYSWNCIQDIEDTTQYISIYYDAIRSIVLPKKSFKSTQDLSQFMAILRKYAAISKIGDSPSPHTYQSPSSYGSRTSSASLLWIVLALIVFYSNSFLTANVFEHAPDVSIVIDATNVVDDSIVALGKIHNPGKSDWQVNMLQMQFYNADGKFIDQCTAYTYSLLVKAGANDNFKISCGVPKKGDPERGNYILPSTLKHFSRIEVKAESGYKTDLFSIFR